MKLLIPLLLLACNAPEEAPLPKSDSTYSMRQTWTSNGKSYSVSVIQYGDVTKVWRHYDHSIYLETYYDDELLTVEEY